MDQNQGHFHGIGIFALRDIFDGEELFVNYLDCNFYDVQDTPDWLIKPPPLAPEFKKAQFEFEFSPLAKLIDRLILSRKLSVYEQFSRQVSHDPSKYELQEKTDLLMNKFPKQFQKFFKKYEDDRVEEGYFANKIKERKKAQDELKELSKSQKQ